MTARAGPLSLFVLLGLSPSFFGKPAAAWIISEHQEISRRAYAERVLPALPLEATELLSEAALALGLCDVLPTRDCPLLNVTALPALAGDHSCTPAALRDMLRDDSGPDGWVRGVLEVSRSTARDLLLAGFDSADREDVRRGMHLELQHVDPEYVQRALLDYSHFQLARESGRLDRLDTYLRFALSPTRQSNATAAYVNYHLSALRLAAGAVGATGSSRVLLVARALLAESFADHFLEDSFSSGHFVGHWGKDATRLGTHDYYSRVGVVASRWLDPPETFVAHGDAFLTEAEADVAAQAVGRSVVQVLRAATDSVFANKTYAALAETLTLEQYDACKAVEVAPGLVAAVGATVDGVSLVEDVLVLEPVPAERFPPVPRAMAEAGPFVGGALTLGGGYAWEDQAVTDDLKAGLRLGYGAAGLVPDPINAQAFADLGFVGEHLMHSEVSQVGYSFRVRAPGDVLFLDGLVAILLAQVFRDKCPWCVDWAASAAGGGPGRLWRTRTLYHSWTWQFSALRDIAADWFPDAPGGYRTQFFGSLLTIRNALPIAGETLPQSTDLYLDVGPSLLWMQNEPVATSSVGAFASVSVATRVFP